MDSRTLRRYGLTQIEVLLIIAIIAILVGLLVVAVVRVRESAARTQSMNNLKQIALATHNFAAANNERLPDASGDTSGANSGISLFTAILPYLAQGGPNEGWIGGGKNGIPVFLSPADPTLYPGTLESVTSYAANAQVFANGPRLPNTFADGASNTIAFAEHYAVDCNRVSFLWVWTSVDGLIRCATFADESDIHPLTQGTPPVSGPSWKGPPHLTFQTAPAIRDCNPGLAQTPHPGGMLVAMGDGSVHQLSPSTAPSVYWALVTPAAGDDPGGDW